MAEGKVVLRFDVFPEEKTSFEKLCKKIGVTNIEFLRRAKALAETQPELFMNPSDFFFAREVEKRARQIIKRSI